MEQIIAALDLGSSKSIAFVAQKSMGKLSVLHSESLISKDAIRRGRVYNLDKTSEIISKLIWKLDTLLSSPIEKLYIGIGGQSLHTKLYSVKKIIEGGTVSQQLLESIKEEALRYKPEFEENFGIASCDYYLDGRLVTNPQGTMASLIEARFQIIMGNPSLKRSLETIFSRKEISVANYIVSPLATAEAVLTPREKELGCALVEWGDGVTYVSVYKNMDLKFMITLPLGGLAITKDIRSLNVSEEEAETLKINHGKAILEPADSNESLVNEEQNPSRKIELRDLNWIIESRVDEISNNIWTQIQLSGYSHTLEAGIIITGGGAMLRNLPLFIQNLTGKEVRLANPKIWHNQAEIQLSPALSCVVGLTILGKENCLKEKEKEKEKATKKKWYQSETDNKVEIKPSKAPEENYVASIGTRGFRKITKTIEKILDQGTENVFLDEESEKNITHVAKKNATNIQHKDKNSTNKAIQQEIWRTY